MPRVFSINHRLFRRRVIGLIVFIIFVYLSVTLYHFVKFTKDERHLEDIYHPAKSSRLLPASATKNAIAAQDKNRNSANFTKKPELFSGKKSEDPANHSPDANEPDLGEEPELDDEPTLRPDDTPFILWWTSSASPMTYYDIYCGNYKCRASNSRMYQNEENVKAFLFYGSSVEPHDLPLPRLNHHLWGLLHEESPKNARFLFNTEEALSLFNYTATFRQESDFPLFAHHLKDADDLISTDFFVPVREKDKIKERDALAPILYIQSDCGTHSDRDTIVNMLQRYIRIDSYGACLHNREMPKELVFNGSMAPLQSDDFLKFVARYKFTLAIENYVCNDYVTEKFWRSLTVGSVPIVFGAPNIKDYLPNNKSAIIIEDFQDIPSLAKYIEWLDTNTSEYEKYMKHKTGEIQNKELVKKIKNRGWSAKDNSRIKSDYDAFSCFMCEKVHEHLERKELPAHIATRDHYGCPKPKRFDEKGKYVAEDERWAYEWNYAKYLGSAMLHFAGMNEPVSDKELEDYALKLKANVAVTN